MEVTPPINIWWRRAVIVAMLLVVLSIVSFWDASNGWIAVVEGTPKRPGGAAVQAREGRPPGVSSRVSPSPNFLLVLTRVATAPDVSEVHTREESHIPHPTHSLRNM